MQLCRSSSNWLDSFRPPTTRKGEFMRSRLSVAVLSLVLAFAFSGCNKQPSQAQSQPPASDNTMAQNSQPATQQQQAAPPPQQEQQQQQQQQQQPPAPVQQAAPPPAPAPPPPPPPLVVPAGASLVVRMGNTIDTKSANAGDTFTGTLAQSVAVDGVVAIPAGAGVAGTVVESKSPGRFSCRYCQSRSRLWQAWISLPGSFR